MVADHRASYQMEELFFTQKALRAWHEENRADRPLWNHGQNLAGRERPFWTWYMLASSRNTVVCGTGGQASRSAQGPANVHGSQSLSTVFFRTTSMNGPGLLDR
jgi:hypothetical protein